MRDNPSRKASRREISQVSHNAARRDISRDFLREISCETSISSTCTYLHTCILTLKYVQTYLPTCKVPYAVSTGLAIQGLRDDTMESREQSGTRLAPIFYQAKYSPSVWEKNCKYAVQTCVGKIWYFRNLYVS